MQIASNIILFAAGLVTGGSAMLCHCRNGRRRAGRAKAAKKGPNKMDIVLIVMAVATVAFVAAMVWLFDRHRQIPETLAVSWFAAVAGEVSICGWIKSAKEKNKDKE